MYAGAVIVQTDRPINDMEKLALNTLTGINPNLSSGAGCLPPSAYFNRYIIS